MASSYDLLLRLCRRTVWKGSAFPELTEFASSEAAPHEIRGLASKQFDGCTESHRLSARCGGRAARESFIPKALLLAAVTIAPASIAFAQEPVSSPAPSPAVSAPETFRVPPIAVDYCAG